MIKIPESRISLIRPEYKGSPIELSFEQTGNYPAVLHIYRRGAEDPIESHYWNEQGYDGHCVTIGGKNGGDYGEDV